jgi:hypothetical protein
MKVRLASAIAIAGLVTAVPAFAAESPSTTPAAPHLPSDAHDGPILEPKDPKWNAFAWARLRATSHAGWALDSLGTKDDQRTFLESRIRAGGSYAILPNLVVAAEGDAYGGVLAGDTSAVGTANGQFPQRWHFDRRLRPGDLELRQLYVAWRTPIGELRAGRVAFKWATGMVANDGRGEPDFGDRRYGDLIDRIVFGTRPFSKIEGSPLAPLAFFVGADRVYRDENADLRYDDRAYQGVGGIRYETDDLALGLFYAYRSQTDRIEPGQAPREANVRAHAIDLYGRVVLVRPTPSSALTFEAEAVTIRGTTTRPLLEELQREGVRVESYGAIGRLRFDDKSLALGLKTELGFASGDRDPYDGVARGFTFDPDYKVGMLLFDPLIGRILGRGIDRVTDPSLVRAPPAGARFLITNGAITNALYLNAVARWLPIETLDLRFGWVVAQNAVPLADPYATAQGGGFPSSFAGTTPARDRALGQEFDLAAKWTVLHDAPVRVRVFGEGAILAAGPAFRGLALGTPWIARGGLDIVW